MNRHSGDFRPPRAAPPTMPARTFCGAPTPSCSPLFRWAVSLCSIAVLGLGPLIAAPEETGEQAIKDMMASGQFKEAVAAAQQRVAAKPGDSDSHVLLANALMSKAKADAAKLPDGTDGPIRLADAEAISKELLTAAAITPARKDIQLGIVDVWVAAGRDQEMFQQIERCASLFPGDIGMMNGLLDYGIERQSRSDPGAARIFEAVYKGYPRQPGAVLAWSSYLLSQGELDRSISILQAAEGAGVLTPDIVEALGDIYCYKLDFPAALKQYSRAAPLDTTRLPVRLKWAALLQVTDPKSSRLLLDPLVGESAGRPPMMQMGKAGTIEPPSVLERAANSLMKAVNAPSSSALDVLVLAKALMQYGYEPLAVVETEIALKKDPLLIEALMLRASLYGRVGLNKLALEALERAETAMETAKDRTFAFSRDEVVTARAAAQSRLGKDEEALATYKRTSDPSRYAYPMALSAERIGRIEEARRLLEQVIASGRDPSETAAAKSRLARAPYRKKP